MFYYIKIHELIPSPTAVLHEITFAKLLTVAPLEMKRLQQFKCSEYIPYKYAQHTRLYEG